MQFQHLCVFLFQFVDLWSCGLSIVCIIIINYYYYFVFDFDWWMHCLAWFRLGFFFLQLIMESVHCLRRMECVECEVFTWKKLSVILNAMQMVIKQVSCISNAKQNPHTLPLIRSFIWWMLMRFAVCFSLHSMLNVQF